MKEGELKQPQPSPPSHPPNPIGRRFRVRYTMDHRYFFTENMTAQNLNKAIQQATNNANQMNSSNGLELKVADITEIS